MHILEVKYLKKPIQFSLIVKTKILIKKHLEYIFIP